jgi:hypothetical protein
MTQNSNVAVLEQADMNKKGDWTWSPVSKATSSK